MRLALAGLVLAGLLVGCGQADRAQNASSQAPVAALDNFADQAQGRAESNATADAPAPPPPAQPGGGQPGPSQPQPTGPAPTLFLAYEYQMNLELPAAQLAGVMDAQQRACQDAGPRLCQLVAASRQGDPQSEMSGTLQIRAEPTWLRTFKDRIGGDVDRAGGRILSQTTVTEDLTRQIVDTEASLRADRALRDRLERLLESRPGRLSDLLEVERELARVQGQIDATESGLAVMRTRVSMSTLTLNYQSSNKPLRSDTFRPLGEAFANFLGYIVMGFAVILNVVAIVLPFALVGGLIAWATLSFRKRRSGRLWARKEHGEESPPKAPT